MVLQLMRLSLKDIGVKIESHVFPPFFQLYGIRKMIKCVYTTAIHGYNTPNYSSTWLGLCLSIFHR